MLNTKYGAPAVDYQAPQGETSSCRGPSPAALICAMKSGIYFLSQDARGMSLPGKRGEEGQAQENRL